MQLNLNKVILASMIVLFLAPASTRADGFKLRLEGNKIIGKNNEGIVPDSLFGLAFDMTNNVDGTYESSHGSVDANDAGSGFNFPSVGPADTFTFTIHGLWTYAGGIASPASPGTILEISKASDGAPLAQVNGAIATPQSFPIAASTTHELLWSVPQSSPVEVWGLAFSIAGNSSVTGLPFEQSQRLVSVQWTPDFQGDSDAAMHAIYAAAVPEPGSLGLLIVATGAMVLRTRRIATRD